MVITGVADRMPFADQYDRLRTDPECRVRTVAAGHNLMLDRPDLVVTILTGHD